MNFPWQGFRKLLSDSETDRQTNRHGRNYIPRRFAGGQRFVAFPESDHILPWPTQWPRHPSSNTSASAYAADKQ